MLNLSKYNVYAKDDSYYLFRALNNADHQDIQEAIITYINSISKIRTDSERAENPKYTKDDSISLYEVYDHIKENYLKETNCISLSSSPCVSLKYGSNYHDEYVAIKVPKDAANIVEAGSYMLDELEKIIRDIAINLDPNSDTLKILNAFDNITSPSDMNKLIDTLFKSKKYRQRFIKKQYLTPEDELRYNKIIGKLTFLESIKASYAIIPTAKDNTKLVKTIMSAFESLELIHYGELKDYKIMKVSKKMMDILSLIEQIKDKVQNPLIDEFENIILGYALDGYDIIERKGIIYLKNDNREIMLDIDRRDVSMFDKIKELDDDTYSIENIYQIIAGKVKYPKARRAIEFAYDLIKSKVEAYDYATILKSLIKDPKYSPIINLIKQCYVINDNITDTRNNAGLKISSSMNISMNQLNKKYFTNLEQKRVIDSLNELSIDELRNILLLRGKSLPVSIVQQCLDKDQTISLKEYYVESIIDSIDLDLVYGDLYHKKELSERELHTLKNKLYKGNVIKLYNSFLKANVDYKDIPYYIINLLIRDGYLNFTFEELADVDDLDIIIKTNLDSLSKEISPNKFDRLIGIKDDENKIINSYISLKDYEHSCVKNINELLDNTSFASVSLANYQHDYNLILTTLLRYKNSKLVVISTTKTNINAIKEIIVKNIYSSTITNAEKEEVLRNILSDDSYLDKYVSLVFPNISFKTYDELTDEEGLDPELIVVDDVSMEHEEVLKSYLNKKVSKVFAIKDTKEDDEILEVLARMTNNYNSKDIKAKRHIALKIDYKTLLKEGISRQPIIIPFAYKLVESMEYKEIKTLIEKSSGNTKKELINILNSMNKIISRSKVKGFASTILENGFIENGRYVGIVSSTDEVDKVVKNFKKNMSPIDENITIYELKDDLSVLEAFYKDNSEHPKLLIINNLSTIKINPNEIDGVFVLSDISNYLNCILSYLSKDKEMPIYDICNNYLEYDSKTRINISSPELDLIRLKLVSKWIKKHGRTPDIKSEDRKEENIASFLSEIKIKYAQYCTLESTPLKGSTIDTIIELGKTFNLWELNIKSGRTQEEFIDAFDLKDSIKEFKDLYTKAESIVSLRNQSISVRILKILEILEILSEYQITINNKLLPLNAKYEDIKSSLPKEVVKLLNIIIPDSYEIGYEFNLAKYSLYNQSSKYINDLSIDTLISYGLFEPIYMDNKEVSVVNEYGFIDTDISILQKYYGYNVRTKSIYDEYGYDINNINKFGFDKNTPLEETSEFDKFGINKKTKTVVDEHSFDFYGYYCEYVNGEYVRTESKTNPRGFDAQGKWHGEYTKEVYYDRDRDDDGYDIDGIDEYGFLINGVHSITGTDYDEQGFDSTGIHKDTKTIVDTHGFDRNGQFYHEKDGELIPTRRRTNDFGFYINGIHSETKKLYNDNCFDIDGYFYDYDSFSCEYVKTDRKYNLDNLDMYGQKDKTAQDQKVVGSRQSKYYYLKQQGEEVVPEIQEIIDIAYAYFECAFDGVNPEDNPKVGAYLKEEKLKRKEISTEAIILDLINKASTQDPNFESVVKEKTKKLIEEVNNNARTVSAQEKTKADLRLRLYYLMSGITEVKNKR